VFDLRPGHALYAGFTLGGLRTSVDGQVRRPDGSVIAGLYAAGACASNIAQDGKGYVSGAQLGEGSFFGRRAGRHAAQLAAQLRRLRPVRAPAVMGGPGSGGHGRSGLRRSWAGRLRL
jgi:succinate dehydrogenase/fumarate reductase flavoprotein subunit